MTITDRKLFFAFVYASFMSVALSSASFEKRTHKSHINNFENNVEHAKDTLKPSRPDFITVNTQTVSNDLSASFKEFTSIHRDDSRMMYWYRPEPSYALDDPLSPSYGGHNADDDVFIRNEKLVPACGDEFDVVDVENKAESKLQFALQAKFGQRSMCRSIFHDFPSPPLHIPAVCPLSFSRRGDVCVSDMRRCSHFKERATLQNIVMFQSPCIRPLSCDNGAVAFNGRCYSPCPYGFKRLGSGMKSKCVKTIYFKLACDENLLRRSSCLIFEYVKRGPAKRSSKGKYSMHQEA